MNILNEQLIKRASRYLYEAPEDNFGADDMASDPLPDETNSEDSDTGENLTKIEVYYSNLDEQTQQLILTSLRSSLNASDDDQFAETKIVEQLSKTPIFVVIGDELQRQLQIRI